MEYVFDIFLLLVWALVIAINTKNGFVKSVWGSVTVFGAYVISYAFGPAVGELICGDYILPRVTEYTFEILQNLASSVEGSYDISSLFTNLPEEFIILADNCGANIDQLSEQFASAVTIPSEQLRELAQTIALPVSRTISNAIGMIVVFFAAMLALAVVGIVVKIIAKLPVIKTIDGVLGFFLGLLKGVVVVSILCVVVAVFVESGFLNGNVGVYFKMLTENSYIFRFVCAISPIDFINIS